MNGINLHTDNDTIIVDKRGLKWSASIVVLSSYDKKEFEKAFSDVLRGATNDVYTFVQKHKKKPKKATKKTLED